MTCDTSNNLYPDDPTGVTGVREVGLDPNNCKFTDGDPTTQTLPSKIPAQHVNLLTDLLDKVIKNPDWGLGSSNNTDNTQLVQVFQNLANLIINNNTIINGNFDIWQRGTSFTAINNAYHADRFAFSKNGAMEYTLSKSTDVPTQLESGLQSNHSLLVACTAQDHLISATEFAKITYSVEGYDFKKFYGNTATLSFWVKGTKTGIYTVGFANADASRVQPVEYTIHASDTWEKKTITLTFNGGGRWNLTNGKGLQIDFALSAGTDHHGVSGTWERSNLFTTANQVNVSDSACNQFRLAQVKLEPGSVATPFIERPFAEELAMCQRYFEKSFELETTPADGVLTEYNLGQITYVDTWQASTKVNLKVRKRTSGYDITFYGVGGHWKKHNKASHNGFTTNTTTLNSNVHFDGGGDEKTERYFLVTTYIAGSSGYAVAESAWLLGDWTVDDEL